MVDNVTTDIWWKHVFAIFSSYSLLPATNGNNVKRQHVTHMSVMKLAFPSIVCIRLLVRDRARNAVAVAIDSRDAR